MATIDPHYMTLDYRCRYRGVPSLDHAPEDFPMEWAVSVQGRVWDESDEDNDGRDVGGDLLVLSSLWVDPRFRGHKIGHSILKAIMGTVGRGTSLVILQAAPVLTDDGPEEDSPQHTAAKAALRRYWADFGFHEAARDYLALGEMADAFDA
jgi:GNAT superfamily N-acetyltransferase